jgi:ATP-dependent helicase/nuclease subunit A
MSVLTPEMMRQRAVEQQRGAADPQKSVWVVASAGTGKTTVLTDRCLRLLLAGSRPERLLCLTFTKAAAAEMANRIAERLAHWAVLDEAALAAALTELLGRAPSDEQRDLARRLFARVLDTPGGMRILTIHAFCQSLLRRFPIEAGVAPHFELLDDRRSEELLLEARDELLAAAAGGENEEFTWALDHVSERVNEQDFADLLRGLVGARSRIQAMLLPYGGFDATLQALRIRLNLAAGETHESIRAAGVTDNVLDTANLRLATNALLAGGKTDQERGQRIAGFLAANNVDRSIRLDLYAKAFLTDKGKIYTYLASAKAVKALPAALTILQREADRVVTLLDRLRASDLLESTRALLTLAIEILRRYQEIKEANVALDYEDLILKSGDLLSRPGVAPWVLFKLDGGIDHILVDEAQDTNPAQWEVIKALAEEFFVGEGVSRAQRTIFAVGDVKQSIFSFQGADPGALGKVRAHFDARLAALSAELEDVPLTISFRSAAAVLQAVDAVFARDAARKGVALDGRVIEHQAARVGQAGRVELWPMAEPLPREEEAEWRPPRERRSGDSPRERLARLIARRIKAMIDGGEILESRGRPVRPGDFLVLVRHRDALVESLVRELKTLNVPVAGHDRMRLGEQIAVMDLMAFGRFLLLPEDDLNLAVLLKSPLLGLDEEALFSLAARREERTLWAELQGRSEFAQARRFLGEALSRADFMPPYELYADLLGRLDGRRKLLGRLGPDAADPIDEFMNLALAYEAEHVPSLQGFLHWLERDDIEIKREGEPGGPGLVRIMTVHGAKGLQAPIVFLPDTVYLPNYAIRLLWLGEDEDGRDLLGWLPRVGDDDAVASAARAIAKGAGEDEGRRLLYVALTRAEDRLYICGWRGDKKAPADCWYETIRAGLATIAQPTSFDSSAELGEGGWTGEGLLHAGTQSGAPKTDEERRRGTLPMHRALPGWLRQPPPPEPTPSRPLSPSRLGEEPPVLSPLSSGNDRQYRRGRLIHRLLQTLPDLPEPERPAAAKRFLANRGSELSGDEQGEIGAETLRLLAEPGFAALFGPGSRAEAPIVGELGDGRVISGQIDRLLVTPSEVLIVDYKTNRPAPRTVAETAQPYLRQMAAYRAALGKIYPGKTIRCALLWTESPRLMALPDALLDGLAP